MNWPSTQHKEERNDRIKSGVITIFVWSFLLFFLFWYKIVEKIPVQQEVVTRMLINFGDNKEGNGAEEPAPQDGSQAADLSVSPTENSVAPKVSNTTDNTVAATTKSSENTVAERIITGNNSKQNIKKNLSEEKNKTIASKTQSKISTAISGVQQPSGKVNKTTQPNAKVGAGDGKGKNAIGNLLAGRGKTNGTQGDGSGIGNHGDPLGGEGNGDSKIGIDRKLTSFIPGTMGRGGAQPTHNCTASGTIIISFTVDKSGHVIQAKRSSGLTDPCAVSTTTAWVKKYVKAEKANVVSTGTYSISF